MTEEDRAKHRSEYVGFVFQSFHLLPGLTAIENVALPMELKGNSNASSMAINYLKMVLHINVIVRVKKLKNKRKELDKKKFLISTIENGEIRKKPMLQKILNQL